MKQTKFFLDCRQQMIVTTCSILLLHIHEKVEGLYFYFSLSFSVCVCPALLVNKIPLIHWFGRGFRLMVACNTGLDPIRIGYLRSKAKVTVTQYQFLFFINLC